MKRFLLLLSVGTLCCGALQAKPKKPDVGELERKLETLDAEIAQTSLELNRMYWDSYLVLARREHRVASMKDYPGVDIPSIRDTVPEIKALQERWSECYEAWQSEVKTAPDYEELHREYQAVRNLPSDDPRVVKSKASYKAMYDSLWRCNPNYALAVKARYAAQFERDWATLRHVVMWYRGQGREMPLGEIIPYKKQSDIRQEWPEVARLESELSSLQAVRRQLLLQIQQLRYGVE